MILNYKGFKLLGGKYKDKFEVGQYVEYRRMSRNENYMASIKTYRGIITDIRCVDSGSRPVWYAQIMINGGKTDLILLSKIRKVETN
jgi:hypothetical protein